MQEKSFTIFQSDGLSLSKWAKINGIMEETSTSIPRSKRPYKGSAAKIRHLYQRNPEMTQAKIAELAGCTTGNVSTVLKRFLGSKITEQEHKHFAENKADVFERLQHRMIGCITDKALLKASPMQLVTATAILEDKLRTIRGQASSYNVTALLDLVESAKAIRDGRPALPSDVQADNRGDKPK